MIKILSNNSVEESFSKIDDVIKNLKDNDTIIFDFGRYDFENIKIDKKNRPTFK